MSRLLVLVFSASLAATGCCLGVICYARSPTYTIASRDGFDTLPERDDKKSGIIRKTSEPAVSDDASPDEAELAALRPYSPEWWSVRDAVDRAADITLFSARTCRPSAICVRLRTRCC